MTDTTAAKNEDVEKLVKAASGAGKSEDALRYSQAALNVANAYRALTPPSAG